MVLGVGIDMVKIKKIEETINKWGDSFIDKVFNFEEVKMIAKGKMYYQRIAARFAAKEAVIKAISKKFPLNFKDIIILNKENGAPYCKVDKLENLEIMLSITHIDDYAVACAVAQKRA